MCCDQRAQVASAQSFSLWQEEIISQDHSNIA